MQQHLFKSAIGFRRAQSGQKNWAKSTILLLIIFLAGCSGSSKHPGFTETSPGIFYKLHIPGESGKKAGPDDFYEVRMLNKYGNTVFFDSDFENGRGTMLMQSSASLYFSVLGEGDSATFLLPGGDLSLPGTPDTGMVEMNVKIVRILSPAEVEKMEKADDPDVNEQLMIHRYLAKNKLSMVSDSTGLYYKSEKEGMGAGPQGGKTVKVIYTGMLFNNHVFDHTPVDSSFSFTWGQDGQVLPGLAKALSHMKAGGKAKIILPSPLAFGAEGSSTGIVPPHTPVVYEVELVSVE